MPLFLPSRPIMLLCAALLPLAACSRAGEGDAVSAAQGACVEIPEGYYLFANGKFYPTSEDMAIEDVPATTQRQVAWSDHVRSELGEAGLDWVALDVAGPVAVLSGSAPSPEARTAALEAARMAIRGDRDARDVVEMVLDAIAVEGDESPPAAAMTGLPPNPEAEDCQAVFDDIMSRGNIEFSSDNSSVTQDSIRTIDALAGAALACAGLGLEAGVHTDARGAQSYNQRISQDRANTVKGLLEERGVSSDRIEAVGYGESRPIDLEQSTEAYARNRRTEFTVLSD